jgi:spermidine synthase
VKPWELLGRAATHAGDDLTLMRRSGEYVIFANGKSLMSSRMHGSEEALATFACRRASTLPEPCVLVGGLGMGFTLRAALDVLPASATVIVAELLPAVVEWNSGALGELADDPLRDPRVLLDVDNGPAAFTSTANAGLYTNEGVAALRAALTAGGVVAVWSAWEDRKFEQRLRYGRFSVKVERVRGRLKKGGPRHTIFVGVAD